MRQFAIGFLVFLVTAIPYVWADDTKPVPTLRQFHEIQSGSAAEKAVQENIDSANATIQSVPNAKSVVEAFFSSAGIEIPIKDFSCIIHVVRWGTDAGKDVVTKSNWYVYNPESTWTDADLLANNRIFGARRPYVLAIHLNTRAGVELKFAYRYTAVHRLPANIQNLQSAIQLGTAPGLLAAGHADRWALGSLEANPPSDITITSAIESGGQAMNLESANRKFDDEGLYRWDISIGVPITSYKQLQTLVDSSGQVNTANVDKRNLLILGNLFLKPVDIKGSTFLTVPHLVGGVSLASKPLHNVVAGLGWGPVITNFYVGAMILTDNLPDHKLDHHVKLAFGLNIPMRMLAGKLGLKTQM